MNYILASVDAKKDKRLLYGISDTEAADILEKAADLYEAEEVDWCSGRWIGNNLFTGRVSVCAGGALALAVGVDQQKFLSSYSGLIANLNAGIITDPHYDRFRNILDLVSEEMGQSLPSWNDTVAKSKSDVIEKLRHLAKDFRNNNIEQESSNK